MSQQLSINELYNQYSGGLLERRQFEGKLFELLLDNLCLYNTHGWKRDDCIDYLSWLYPRLSRAVDSYRDIGASFETYIGSLTRWSAREYYCRGANRAATEYAAWSARAADMYVHSSEPEYGEPETAIAEAEEIDTRQVKNPRQSLILILKCYYYLADDALERLAPRIGVAKEKLKAMVDTLRAERVSHDEEIFLMKERIHSQYYRCIVYEGKLKNIAENTNAHAKLRIQLKNARQRLAAMRRRYSRVRLDATNLQIARLLGIPKGTVDSNLHALKKRRKKG